MFVILVFYLKALIVPISNKKIELATWFRKWNRNDYPVVDSNRAKGSTSLVEVDGWEIRESANLIF